MRASNILYYLKAYFRKVSGSAKRGFTLVELIIVIAISSFVVGAAYTSIQSVSRLTARQTSQISNQNDTRIILSYLTKDLQNLPSGTTPQVGTGDTLYVMGDVRYYKVSAGNIAGREKVNIYREVNGKEKIMIMESVLGTSQGFLITNPNTTGAVTKPYYDITITFIDKINKDNVKNFKVSPRKGVILENFYQVSVPSATPASGVVTLNTAVTLTTLTEGATIYYTLDGSTPTSSSIKYVAPIIIDSAKTIKAIAIKEGMVNSELMTESYTTNISQVAIPVATPQSGNVAKGSAVSLSTATPGASIYYTLDGTAPTISSYHYYAAIIIDNEKTIKAIAVKGGMIDSLIMTESYTISSSQKEILSYGFKDVQTQYLNINPTERTVLIEVPNGTNLNNLIANFTLSPGATAKIGSVTQQSGVTSNNFSAQFMTYTVTAQDGTQNDWTVYVYTKQSGLLLNIVNGVTYVNPLTPTYDATGKLVILAGELTVDDKTDFVYTAKEGILVNPSVVLKADHAQSKMTFDTAGGDIDIRGTLISTAPNNNDASIVMIARSGNVDLSNAKQIETLRDIYIEAKNNINLRNAEVVTSKNNTDLILNAGKNIYYNNTTELNDESIVSNSDLVIRSGILTYSP